MALLPTHRLDTAVNARRWVAPEALNVAPALVGQPLAQPKRRALAMGLDLLAVALISGARDLWLFAGLLIVLLQLRRKRSGGTAWAPPGWLLAAVLLGLALSQAGALWRGRALAEADPARAEAREAAEAARELAAAPAASAPLERIAQLEAQLEAEREAARKARPPGWREQLDGLWESVASRFGWGIVYFSLLPAWWGGQTLGKRVLGLRVVELTGRPMTVMLCLKRYGGYAAGMATGGLGFLQMLWDPNRQALQDKAAHTVVIDLRAPAAAQAPPPIAAEAPVGEGTEASDVSAAARALPERAPQPGPVPVPVPVPEATKTPDASAR
jgi:uncharacterized RDD family membrane protein YckC